MSKPDITNTTVAPSSLQPVATNLPRRISFGSTPVPVRPANTRTPTTTSASKANDLQGRLFDDLIHKPLANSPLEQCVPAQKVKSMSHLDKQEEARMAKLYKAKATKGGVAGVMEWLEKKVKSEEGKKG